VNTQEFYKIEQQLLLLEAKKISLFTSHAPTLGAYRENVLKKYLRKFIPGELNVSSGFVIDSASKVNQNNISSKQIDVLIYNSHKSTPILETDGFSIISKESLLGCIEVKSSLTFYKSYASENSDESKYPLRDTVGKRYRWSGTVMDALENICQTATVAQNKTYFSGILSYDAEFDVKVLYSAFSNESIQEQLGIKHLNDLPMYICVPGKYVIVFSHFSIFDQQKYHDEYESYFNYLGSHANFEQFPLQFFSQMLHSQLVHLCEGAIPVIGSIMDSGGNTTNTFSEHFKLNSSGL